MAVTVADALDSMAGSRQGRRRAIDLAALSRVRAHLLACPEETTMVELEMLSGLDRWKLSRQFRAAYGTSPYRFRTLRRLERVRHLIVAGSAPAEAAAGAGFADQSHMTRQFKRTYGLTPARWAAAVAASETA